MIATLTEQTALKTEILGHANELCSTWSTANVEAEESGNLSYRNDLVLFLLEAYNISNNQLYLDNADHIATNSLNLGNISINNLAFEGGWAGLIYCHLKLFEVTDNQKYLRPCEEIVRNSINYFLESDQVGDSLYKGRTGLLLVILSLYDKTGDKEFLVHIISLTNKIISNAVVIEGGFAWYNPYELVIRPLCSFGYGAAGMGYAFNLLGRYFNHKPFIAVAERCFVYVNDVCFNKDQNSWNDYRKNITCEEELKEHTNHFLDNNKSFFEKPSTCNSIAHGTAGIIYAQLSSENVKNKSLDWLAVKTESPDDIFDLALLQLDLFSRLQESSYLTEANALISRFQELRNNQIDLDTAILKMSLLRRESSICYLPKFNLRGQTSEPIILGLLTNTGIFRKLMQKTFGRTVHCLNQLNSLDKSKICQDSWANPLETLEKLIQNSNYDRKTLDTVEKIFLYEKELYLTCLKQRQNPYFHVSMFCNMNKRIASLQIKNSELIKKKLRLSQRASLKNIYDPVKYHSTVSIKSIIPTKMFWKNDVEHGVEEQNIEPLKFVIEGFKIGKCLKAALEETLHYFNSLSLQELKPILEFSNSRNKQDLMSRFPFIYLYQIKILIAEGLLEFYENQI